MSDPTDYRAWLSKADSDRVAIAKLIVGEPVPWDIVCFHAQQLAEKLLKAYIVSKGHKAERTHDLIALLHECTQLGAPVEARLDDCKFLVRFSISARYPGEAEDPSAEDGRRAQAAAEGVRAAVLELLPPQP